MEQDKHESNAVNCNGTNEKMTDVIDVAREERHRNKRLAQVLRYIASMHHSMNNNNNDSEHQQHTFIRQIRNNKSHTVTRRRKVAAATTARSPPKTISTRRGNESDDDGWMHSSEILPPDFFHHNHYRSRRRWNGGSQHASVSRRGTNTGSKSDAEEEDDDDPFDGDDVDNYNGGGAVLFTTNDFRRLIAMEESSSSSSDLFDKAPFSFYAASASTKTQYFRAGNNTNTNRKRSVSGAFKDALLSGVTGRYQGLNRDVSDNMSSRGYWLRITRLSAKEALLRPPSIQHSHPVVQRYLKIWLESAPRVRSIHQLLTLERLEGRKTPKLAPTLSVTEGQHIQSFLLAYRKYLRQKMYQETLEPIYNRLFEWVQQRHSHYGSRENDASRKNNYNNDASTNELVFGLGHARMLVPNNNTGGEENDDEDSSYSFINGPLLEILVEVELASDGALLVRPREHTGVALNRAVVSAIVAATATPRNHNSSSAADNSTCTLLSELHREVAELEASRLSPGQPATYVPLLKRVAVELSPGGSFQSSSSATWQGSDTSLLSMRKLVVTEAWCLYSRPRPSSVWARDATAFADQLAKSSSTTKAPISSQTTFWSKSTNGGKDTDMIVPKAVWSISHGPGMLEKILETESNTRNMDDRCNSERGLMGWLQRTLLGSGNGINEAKSSDPSHSSPDGSLPSLSPSQQRNFRPLFPLPTSDTQNKIAELLLEKNYPAVVLEGPPGTGKSHTIANIICAYLCQGKRVLVTSKNAPALSVLRDRLPESVRDLCVDVSMSELSGMRQLQKTVERLANKVACSNPEMESRKCALIQDSITELEERLSEIDETMSDHSEKIQDIMKSADGERMVELSLSLIKDSPWLMKSISSWEERDVVSLQQTVAALDTEDDDPIHFVSGFVKRPPPTDALVSYCSAKAGSSVALVSMLAKNAVASFPVIGSISGIGTQVVAVVEESSNIRYHGNSPSSKRDWGIVVRAMNHARALFSFEHDIWKPFQHKEKWPVIDFSQPKNIRHLNKILTHAVSFKGLVAKLQTKDEILQTAECRALDATRSKICSQIQFMAEELVDAAVVKELSRAFSPDAQSALIQFSQLAGKSKFCRSSQASKMTQRQRRRRQEYLDSFNRCSRFIPCWILTTSQISDYLPPECIFDIVIIDEASQSDVTVLPGMLRGKQWLIVGDGKQVSPTECFVSEDQIDSLRAALPSSPLENSLLPGQSFFDLCSQAYPRGRVVLNEHFRCAEEIIAFSNEQFYDGRLVPLRLPTKSQRLAPSIIDVKINDGVKTGKVNVMEAAKIVEMIQEIVTSPFVRTIGIISLIGDEQSRLIRGKLLDAIGPEKMAHHNILVGDPPTFQGAERDIIFLSMVASRGSVPTQNQLMHCQRANVAMSRARDRCVLVRSLEITDIPSFDDIKIPIIEFFLASKGTLNTEEHADVECPRRDCKREGAELLKSLLVDHGYEVRWMGDVWKNAICVEQEQSDSRVGILVDCEAGSHHEWRSSFLQQQAIERVGWKCLRLDALSLYSDVGGTLAMIRQFLKKAGLDDKVESFADVEQNLDQGSDIAPEEDLDVVDDKLEGLHDEDHDVVDAEVHANADQKDVFVISSDNDSCSIARDAKERYASSDLGADDDIDAGQFGQPVDLHFLRGSVRKESHRTDEEVLASLGGADELNISQTKDRSGNHMPRGQGYGIEKSLKQSSINTAHTQEAELKSLSRKDTSSQSEDNALDPDDEETSEAARKRQKRYKRLDKYSRDGRWYPGPSSENIMDDDTDSYLKDSDYRSSDDESVCAGNGSDKT